MDKIPKAVSGKAGELLEKVDERKQLDAIAEELELKKIWDRPLDVLSGGELAACSGCGGAKSRSRCIPFR